MFSSIELRSKNLHLAQFMCPEQSKYQVNAYHGTIFWIDMFILIGVRSFHSNAITTDDKAVLYRRIGCVDGVFVSRITIR